MRKSYVCRQKSQVSMPKLGSHAVAEFLNAAIKHSKQIIKSSTCSNISGALSKRNSLERLQRSLMTFLRFFRQYFPNTDKLWRGIWFAPSGQQVLLGYCGEQHMHRALCSVSYSVKKALETILKPTLKNLPYVEGTSFLSESVFLFLLVQIKTENCHV